MMEELCKAMVDFQSRIGAIPKRQQGHGYKYADLDTIWEYIRKPLAGAGLSIMQCVESVEGRLAVRTILAHVSGQSISSVSVAPAEGESNKRMSAIQALGSEITYLRRYALSAVLGLTTDEDTDGAWAHDYDSDAEAVYTRASAFETKEEFTKLRLELEKSHGKGKIPKVILDAMNKAFAELNKESK